MRKKNLIIALLIASAFSCKKEDEVIVGKILPDFQVYVDRFVAEAKLRGKEISTKSLTVDYGTVAPHCGYGWSNPPRVNIDKDCWASMPDIPREIIIFHELGHAILGRSHDIGVLPNGDYRSMMYENPTTLYNAYVPAKRIYYLDELFDASTGVPKWSLPKTNETVVLTDEISNNGTWNFAAGNANQVGAVVDSIFLSPPSSLMIHSNGSSSGFSYWSYSWKPTDIEEGDDLLLKVRVTAKGVSGKGAFFAFRADINNKDVAFLYSTEKTKPVLGDQYFQEYSIKVTYFPNSSPTLNIFLILDGTSTGTVYFDDIKLIKYN